MVRTSASVRETPCPTFWVVLPLKNVPDDSNYEYLSDGITDLSADIDHDLLTNDFVAAGRLDEYRDWLAEAHGPRGAALGGVRLYGGTEIEQFVFDAIPLAKNAIVLETDRAEEFSPVKNAEGVDSPATSRRDQVRRAARWLRRDGHTVIFFLIDDSLDPLNYRQLRVAVNKDEKLIERFKFYNRFAWGPERLPRRPLRVLPLGERAHGSAQRYAAVFCFDDDLTVTTFDGTE